MKFKNLEVGRFFRVSISEGGPEVRAIFMKISETEAISRIVYVYHDQKLTVAIDHFPTKIFDPEYTIYLPDKTDTMVVARALAELLAEEDEEEKAGWN